MSRGSIFWGIVLILLGSLFILNNLGFLTFNIWRVLGPSLLVLLGIWVLLSAFIGKGTQKIIQTPLNQVKSARVRFEFAAGRLTIHGNAEPANLLDGEVSESFGMSERRDGDRADIKLSLQPQFFPVFWVPGGAEWDLRLNDTVQFALNVNTGACDSTIDLSGLKVNDFELSTGASATKLILPSDAGVCRFVVKAGLASVNIYIPQGVAARIKASAGLGTVSVDQNRFPRQKDRYVSGDFESSANRVDLVVETGLGAVDIQ